MSSNEITWTVVTRNPRGRFFRPVTGVIAGSWLEAVTQADALVHAPSVKAAKTEVFVVPAAGSIDPRHEDFDNVLAERGRRIPIQWDAAPQHELTLAEAVAGRDAIESRHVISTTDRKAEYRAAADELVSRLAAVPFAAAAELAVVVELVEGRVPAYSAGRPARYKDADGVFRFVATAYAADGTIAATATSRGMHAAAGAISKLVEEAYRELEDQLATAADVAAWHALDA